MIITFSESAKRSILDIFDMATDESGNIINKKTRNIIVGADKKPVHISEFAGLHKDFGIIKSDINSLIAFADHMKEKHGYRKE